MLHSLSPPSLHLSVPATVCNNKGSERRYHQLKREAEKDKNKCRKKKYKRMITTTTIG